MALKEYSTLCISSEQDLHNQMQLSVILKISIFVNGVLLLCKRYNQCSFSPGDLAFY